MLQQPALNADNVLPPASGHNPRQLVLLLHGYGANGADLMPLAETWQKLLPQAEFIAPNAPQACNLGFGFAEAYQWFSLDDITPELREERVRQVAPLLNRFIDDQLAQRRLHDKHLLLAGFSQGTIMALFVALRRPRPCAGILGYSGRLAAAEALPLEIASKPRTFLMHGAQDEVIPVMSLYQAASVLKKLQVPLASYVVPNVGHGINEVMADLGGQFAHHCLTRPGESLDMFAQNRGVPTLN